MKPWHELWSALWPLAPVLAAVVLDAWIGDPRSWPHPVQVMGWGIERLRHGGERWAGDSPIRLRLAGGAITAGLVLVSGGSGWVLERLALQSPIGWIPLVVALASALAWRSLTDAVRGVLAALAEDDGSLNGPRRRLAWIVGRDVERLDRGGILRAAAETASENAVDGVFAPLFWMLLGSLVWLAGALWMPGPLALAWAMKAASTLDSMLGYRRGRLRWLGTAGARLDDALVWLPARLVPSACPGGRAVARWLPLCRPLPAMAGPMPLPTRALGSHLCPVIGWNWAEPTTTAARSPSSHRWERAAGR
ncbi:CobD/CbiB family cobalamin biosynthesis protein [Synechococcus sp. RSCCF101]|uniref:CobD/CbiB family cobalamin biosynthesis protein n=1 Tax=Synechococcus sp. RSCCF101 TaxID=2511069 RepID=UPI00351A0024